MSSILGLLLVLAVLTLVLHVIARVLRVSIADESRYRRAWLPTHWREPFEEGEEVRFLAADGFELAGTFLHRLTEKNRGIVVYSHDSGGDRWDALPYVEHLRAEGYDVFTFDDRTHAQRRSGFQRKRPIALAEADIADLRAAVVAAISRDSCQKPRVAIIGVGKGAAAALNVACGEPAVRGLVLDSLQPPSERTASGRPQRRDAWSRRLARRLMPRSGKPAPELVEVARSVRIPVLLIQGRSETRGRLETVRDLASAIAGPCQLWIVPAARHAEAVHLDRHGYQRRSAKFLHQTMQTSLRAVPEPAQKPAATPLARHDTFSFGSAR